MSLATLSHPRQIALPCDNAIVSDCVMQISNCIVRIADEPSAPIGDARLMAEARITCRGSGTDSEWWEVRLEGSDTGFLLVDGASTFSGLLAKLANNTGRINWRPDKGARIDCSPTCQGD